MGAVSAAVQYPDGGVWTYGEGSEAWIWTEWGEQVSFFYDYDD
jgi:hypothetical protein